MCWDPGQEDNKKPCMNLESLNLFLELGNSYITTDGRPTSIHKISYRNPKDMDFVRRALEDRKCNEAVIEGVVLRFKYLASLD